VAAVVECGGGKIGYLDFEKGDLDWLKGYYHGDPMAQR